MEPQPAKPVSVVRIPIWVPAHQAEDWPRHVESICKQHGVRARVTAEPGRTATMFIFELRGSPEGLRDVQGKLEVLISTIALTPTATPRSKRIVVAAISFAIGLGAVLLIFTVAA